MKTVLITGCSSGFGVDTARYFLEREWKVIATMRTPKEGVLPSSPNLRIVQLDITSAESIQKCAADAGDIDALVNNAGIGWLNALEGTSMATAHEVFETNTLGPIALIQAVLPRMRERKSGVIVNVSSTVTLKPLPLLSVYTASKAALNAFTESVAIELEPFGIRARVVLPGRSPTTKFGENARSRMTEFPAPYSDLVKKVMAAFQEPAPTALTTGDDVAEAVWKAVTDPSTPMRTPAGADAVALARSVA